MAQEKIRRHFDFYISQTEVAIYSGLAVLLAVTAFVTIANAAEGLWLAIRHWSLAAQPVRLLDELLVVLMMVEILHTVRISIRSHVLVTEPFLIVGLIASIRRVLVITLQAATLAKDGEWTGPGAISIFHASMIELGLLALVIFVLVVSITLLRRYAPSTSEER
jgi:Phosphate-starvation-inducible E family